VLGALLWGFHNSRDGRCFPSYDAIAAKAECHRWTAAQALKVLEWAGVLTWQHRIQRVRERCRCLLTGREGFETKLLTKGSERTAEAPPVTSHQPAMR
jgi:hypothetical protein